jgi:hypothetical protein
MHEPPTYEQVERELVEALGAKDASAAAAARKRALLQLALVATGPNFDEKRHRAISIVLREVDTAPDAAPLAPLMTRGVR